MLFATVGQVWIFLAMVYAGLMMGLAYDFFRMLRLMLWAGRGMTAVMDLLFALAGAAIALRALVAANGGELRLFALGGCAVGAVLYLTGASPFVMGLFCRACIAARRTKENILNKNLTQRFLR